MLGIFRKTSPSARWPIAASSADQLEGLLHEHDHLLPLPKEPAALANILEVSIVDYLLTRLDATEGAEHTRGTERGYPDLEISGPAFGGSYHAVDVKVARRGDTNKSKTQSRITLYTGNTYFKWPDLHWPGTMRTFNDYRSHLDIIIIYTLDSDSKARVQDMEIIVQQPWKIASKQRSSTTREYLGAVESIAALRDGRGEFSTPAEFYRFWRAYPFKISAQVQKQLARLVQKQQQEIEQLRGQTAQLPLED
ncbi:restriction endonuclease [Lentzea aerocolonigenes]|uniref:Restriction endonuclease n=1 Tax=Lentzea aerocolonigenes TaxID=68170 RepID=A0A0F0H835_LENAE|nr:restriction endonuclease [Lentzea aerocolonigenes]